MDNETVLKKLAENSEKSLKYSRISAFCMIGILCVVLVSALKIIPAISTTVNEVYTAVQMTQQIATEASETLEKINGMADSVKGTSEDFNTFLGENTETITESLEKMSKIDFDGLNQGIKDLQDAVGPFANFMNKFR